MRSCVRECAGVHFLGLESPAAEGLSVVVAEGMTGEARAVIPATFLNLVIHSLRSSTVLKKNL